MQDFLIVLLQCTASMSLVTLFYAAVLLLLSKRYAAKWCYIVWIFIAACWVIPFRPLIKLPIIPAMESDMSLVPVKAILTSPKTGDRTWAVTAAGETAADSSAISLWTVAAIVWIVGVIFLIAYHALRHRYFMKIVSRWSEPVKQPEILNMLDTLKREEGIKAKVQLKTYASVTSPMLVGFIHPIILMPPVQLSQDELALILRHELIHFKRHDLWHKAMILMAIILHWFNPVVYYMARAASLQCEISCDELVLLGADMQTRRQYGEAIIAVVRNESKVQTALSTNFYGGKQGMKNRMVSILDMKHKKAGIIVLCLALVGILLTGGHLVSGSGKNELAAIPNTAFTDEEYDKLLALQFDGYENMTISEYQEKVRTATDTAEYRDLLNRFEQDTQLYEMRDTNETASFLFYVLEPLTAEKWQTRTFGGYATSTFEVNDNATLEYELSFTILDSNRLTVGEYNKSRLGVKNALQSSIQNRTKEELNKEQIMNETISTEINSLTNQWGSDNLKITISYVFKPLMVYEDNGISVQNADETEERPIAYGTEDDYRSLLTLKTADYKNMSVSNFNASLLEWANEDQDRIERIRVDTVWNDFLVSLTDDERAFVTLTVLASGIENEKYVQSNHVDKPEENPIIGDINLYKDVNDGGYSAWCRLYYQFSYDISDNNNLTIGERDRCLAGVINGIQRFWDETSLDELLNMSESDMVSLLKNITAQYSNDLITVIIDENDVGFEHMDERS